jgi:hypothetical protein
MDGFQKVVVVDNGDRPQDFALSAELAEMGFASVTTPVETADDVLAIVRSPAAIVLQMPQGSRLGRAPALHGACRPPAREPERHRRPVIVLGGPPGAASTLLQSELGARILSKPEL